MQLAEGVDSAEPNLDLLEFACVSAGGDVPSC
jgi:hypothetical protein|eukprot:COSAG01_NODE_1522_length_10022_cov_81.163761_4_plen_32_part_00